MAKTTLYHMSYGDQHETADTLKAAREKAKRISRRVLYEIQIIGNGDLIETMVPKIGPAGRVTFRTVKAGKSTAPVSKPAYIDPGPVYDRALDAAEGQLALLLNDGGLVPREIKLGFIQHCREHLLPELVNIKLHGHRNDDADNVPEAGKTPADFVMQNDITKTRSEWVAWLQSYGAEKFFDAFMRNAQGARSTCVHCHQPIFLDIAEGGGVPDWCDESRDYGCAESPDTNSEGCGSHAPERMRDGYATLD